MERNLAYILNKLKKRKLQEQVSHSEKIKKI